MNSIQVRSVAPDANRLVRIPSIDAWEFVALLVRKFRKKRLELLAFREQRQRRFLSGKLPHFLTDTASIRGADWKIAPVPKDLVNRQVEITGPSADAKMVINAFNSGAMVYMADFEDSQTPTWRNTILGQQNLYDAVRGKLRYESPEGKRYELNPERAVLMMRPRGWHLTDADVLIDSMRAPASLVDFGLFFYHNAEHLIHQGTGPYFYLPKLESFLEARLWNEVFETAQDSLGIPRGTIKATVLIETLPAVFEMDEILYELREHSAGLNCGRWDYIFSFIKKLGHNPEFIFPDRSQLGMDKTFLSSYACLLVDTCHRRGAHAMGGMAAQIPIKNDPIANEVALAKVREDKLREVSSFGHDGTWVAHPGLVPLALEIFQKHLPGPNQIDRRHTDTDSLKKGLLSVPAGTITEAGIRTNIRIMLQYLESWLRGNGCVPLYNLMEDAATAEISRAQIWQWHKHKAALDDGRQLDTALLNKLFKEEVSTLGQSLTPQQLEDHKYSAAIDLFQDMVIPEECPSFLTIPAYEEILGPKK